MIRFVCKARTRHGWSPSWAAGVPSRRPQSQYSTGWISSRPTLLGVLGSYVGPHDCSSGQARQVQGPWGGPRQRQVSVHSMAVGAVVLTGMGSRSCMSGGQNRRSPAGLRSAHEPRGCDDGLHYLYPKTPKRVSHSPAQHSTVRLRRGQTAPAIARAARARAWRTLEE